MSHRPISGCHLPWEWLIITPDGSATPCCWSNRMVGNLRHQTMDEIWNGPDMVQLRKSIVAGYVDSVCRDASCSYVQDTLRLHGDRSHDYRIGIGKPLSLRDDQRSSHCLEGWAEREAWGRWTLGQMATLRLEVVDMPREGVTLEVLCRGIGHERFPESAVDVLLNGVELAHWRFAHPHQTERSSWRSLPLPPGLTRQGPFDLCFHIPAPRSPATWGSLDTRPLGLGVSEIRLLATPSGASADEGLEA